MIFDRTQSDVDAAIRLRNEKVKTFKELTEEDFEILERGTLTTNTINRIEQKQDYLKNLFNGMGYFNTNTQNKPWDFDEIFYGYDLERIANNANILKNAFFVYSGTPQTPSPSYDYKTFNDLEKILYDLDVMINDVKSHYRECGTFECGGNE